MPVGWHFVPQTHPLNGSERQERVPNKRAQGQPWLSAAVLGGSRGLDGRIWVTPTHCRDAWRPRVLYAPSMPASSMHIRMGTLPLRPPKKPNPKPGSPLILSASVPMGNKEPIYSPLSVHRRKVLRTSCFYSLNFYSRSFVGVIVLQLGPLQNRECQNGKTAQPHNNHISERQRPKKSPQGTKNQNQNGSPAERKARTGG